MGMTKKELIAELLIHEIRQDMRSKGAVISKQTIKDVLASLAVIITHGLAGGSKAALPGIGKIKVAGKKVKKVGKAKPEKKIKTGQFAGKILSIDGDQVVQKIGRTLSETVRHDIGRLTRKPAVGEVVTIVYKGKVGVVTD